MSGGLLYVLLQLVYVYAVSSVFPPRCLGSCGEYRLEMEAGEKTVAELVVFPRFLSLLAGKSLVRMEHKPAGRYERNNLGKQGIG